LAVRLHLRDPVGDDFGTIVLALIAGCWNRQGFDDRQLVVIDRLTWLDD
jgi:hypothetical protein